MTPIDLRSDTVTQPTPAMRAVMAAAPLGARVAHRAQGRTLKRVFAIVLYALATNMLVSTFR